MDLHPQHFSKVFSLIQPDLPEITLNLFLSVEVHQSVGKFFFTTYRNTNSEPRYSIRNKNKYEIANFLGACN